MTGQFNALTTINIELTSRCNKKCWMCGRRKIDTYFPEIAMDYGDMDFELVRTIALELPEGIVVQFHNNGEALLYPRFGEAIRFFDKQIKCLDTNAKLLVEKADEIIDNLDTLTISVIENDPEGAEQWGIVNEFLKIKGKRKPLMIYRCLGKVDLNDWKFFDGMIVTRTLHNPMGSFGYKKQVTKPEIGICLDLLNHLVIDRYGCVSPCVRFDPYKKGQIGNVNKDLLLDIWNGPERKKWLKHHIEGRRNMIPLCAACEYWGIGRG